MRSKPASIRICVGTRLWRRYGFAARLTGCFFLVFLATLFVSLFDGQGACSSLIWVADGLLLSFLLLAPRRRWPAYLSAGFIGMFTAHVLVHKPFGMNLLYCMLDILEVGIGALLLRRRSTDLPRFTDRNYLLRFLGFAVLIGPLTSAAIFALTLASWHHAAPAESFLRLVLGDSLGIAVTTLVGQQLGGNRPELAARGTWTALVLALGYMGTMALLYLLTPDLFLFGHALGTAPATFRPG